MLNSKHNYLKKTTAIVFVFLLVLSGVIPSMSGISGNQNKAYASEVDTDWEEIQDLLSNIKGVWDAPPSGVVTDKFTRGPIMGNGDVGVVIGGTANSSTFYISKSDFWTDDVNGKNEPSPIALGGITVKQSDTLGEKNLALNKPAQASSNPENPSWAPRAVDGNLDHQSHWYSEHKLFDADGNLTKELWFMVDLEEEHTISRWVVKHAGADESPDNGDYNLARLKNTRDFKLQKSNDGKVWKDVDEVTDNTEDITDCNVDSFNARYVRIYITKPAQKKERDTRARIYELELYEQAKIEDFPIEDLNITLNKIAIASDTYSNDGATSSHVNDGDMGTKWCSIAQSEIPGDKWIAIDLGQNYDINRWVVKHAGAGGETSKYNTQDFKLQKSNDGQKWECVDSVIGNKANITDRNVTTFNTRYLRLYITKPVQDNCDYDQKPGDRSNARIFEIEVYKKPMAYHQEQDILNAKVHSELSINNAPVKMSSWTAATENLLVTEMWTDGSEPVPVSVDTWTKSDNATYPAQSGIEDDIIWATRETKQSGRWISKAAIATRIIGAKDVKFSTNKSSAISTAEFMLQPNQPIKILSVVTGGGLNPITHLKDAKAEVTQLDNDVIDDLNVQHLKWWKDFWLKSYIRVHDDLLEKYYYGALYELACSSNERTKVGPGLYGIWITTDNPSWRSDIHLNYNGEAPYYGVYAANRPELATSYYDIILDFVPEGKRRAQEEMGKVHSSLSGQSMVGVLYPVGIGPWGYATGNGYWNQVSNASYAAIPFIDYYYYTHDINFLNTKAYPYVKEVANFWESYLSTEYINGNKQYYLNGGIHEGAWGKNPILDLGYIRKIMKFLLETSIEIGKDEDKREVWTDILDNLSPYPLTTYKRKTVFAWDANSYYKPKGNLFGMEFVFPGDGLGLGSNTNELQIAKNTYEFNKDWGQINNFPRIFTMGFRIGFDTQTILNGFKNVISSQMQDNLTINDDVHGIEKAGAIEAIHSMILQSHEDVLRLFPAWTTDKTAKFKRLRAKGAFLVSSEFKDGEVSYVDITSEKGKTCKVVSPWPGRGFSLVEIDGDQQKSVNYEFDGVTMTFDTQAGKQYKLLQVPALTSVTLSADNITLGNLLGIDKTQLGVKINKTDKLQGVYYTAETWVALQEVFNVAKVVYANEEATQEQVNKASEDLEIAIVELKEIILQDKNIISATSIENKNVAYGTSFNDIGLPATVEVILDATETTTAVLEVEWKEEGYNGNEAGEYTLHGTLKLVNEIKNENNVEALVKVIVKEQHEQPEKDEAFTISNGYINRTAGIKSTVNVRPT